MSRLSIRAVIVAAVFLVPLLVVGTSTAEWTHAGGNSQGTGHVEGQGAISGGVSQLPGTSSIVQAPATDFSVDLFADANGDGQVEALRIFQERLGAFDLGNGQPLWLTPSMGFSALRGVADINGDGLAQEAVVVATGIGGGVHVIDLPSGTVQHSFTGLTDNSGVRADELVLSDVDGDGAQELIFAASLLLSPFLYVVDFSTEDGEPRAVSSELQGYYLQTNRLAVGDFGGDGIAGDIVTLQADWLDLKRICSPSSEGAVCDLSSGTLCLCDVALIEDAFSARIFPQTPRAVDVDGDGSAELVTVHRHGSHANGFGVVELSSYFDGSSSPEVAGWLYDYSAQSSRPAPHAASGLPRDLSGDEQLDLVVTLAGPSTGEVDRLGLPIEDGLDNPTGCSFGIFSGADGQLLGSLDAAVAHGYIDLDGDGADEIVVERVGAEGLGDGGVEGWGLTCSGSSCEFAPVWAAPDHRVTRFPEGYAADEVPALDTLRVLSGDDPQQGLLLWSEDALEHVVYDGSSGVVALASVALATDDVVAGVADLGDEVLVNRGGLVTLYDGSLAPRSEYSEVLSGTVLRLMAGSVDPGRAGSSVLIDGHLFFDLDATKDLADADAILPGDVALIADVDGDLAADLFVTEDSMELGGSVVSRYEYDSLSGELALLWSWESNAAASPVFGMAFRSLWSFTEADFTGDGVGDLAFSMESYPSGGIVVLDGVSGELVNSSLLTARDSQWGPMLVGDFSSPSTYGVPDGAMDLLRPSRLALEAWIPGDAAPVESRSAEVHHASFMFGDLGGDGGDELVMGRLFSVIDPALEAVSLEGALVGLWGPVTDLEPPPGTEQAMVLATVDGVPGQDILLISSSGAVDARAGSTGERLAGFPLWVGLGQLLDDPPTQPSPLRSIISLDVDGDGHDEAVVGGADGYVYALDVATEDPEAPGLLWDWFGGGAPISGLAAADVDGDTFLEVLVTASDGTARVIDGLGVSIAIVQPDPEDCLESTTFSVCGTSLGVDLVDVHVQGLPRAEQLSVNEDGSWCGEVSVPAVAAQVEIVAVGWMGGVPVVSDQIFITSAVDQDSDGVTVCGGDCDDDDAAVAPGLLEICDGLDNDCDPSTSEDADTDGDGASVCGGDCDDTEERVSPIGIEDCDDGLDNDCDGAIDSDDEACGGQGGEVVGDNCCDSDGCSTALSWDSRTPWAMPARSLLLAGLGLVFLRRRRRACAGN